MTKEGQAILDDPRKLLRPRYQRADLAETLGLHAEDLLIEGDIAQGQRIASLALRLGCRLPSKKQRRHARAIGFGRLALFHQAAFHQAAFHQAAPHQAASHQAAANQCPDDPCAGPERMRQHAATCLRIAFDEAPRSAQGYLYLCLARLHHDVHQGGADHANANALHDAHRAVALCGGKNLVRAHALLIAALDANGDHQAALESARQGLLLPDAGTVVAELLDPYAALLLRLDDPEALREALDLLPQLCRRLRRSEKPQRAKVHWLEGRIHAHLVRRGEQARYHSRKANQNLQFALQSFIALRAQPEIATLGAEIIELSEAPELVAPHAIRQILPHLESGMLASLAHVLFDAARRKRRDAVVTSARMLRSKALQSCWNPLI